MKRVCCKCKKNMGRTDESKETPKERELVTHGICKDCAKKILRDNDKEDKMKELK